ncbi:MAG TPA: NAD(P)H-dependent oxidoreductase [Acidimicrobiales bacterium]|nr:NAD(P)H-dependent oxidoreductase [Acidimicrobiales bacterium]
MQPLKLNIIIGTVRPGRAADPVARWVTQRAEEHGEFEVELLDLRDWPLPYFAEGAETIGDFADPTYSDPVVKAWNNKQKEADAVVFITAEYNHSIPGVLKNAIDNVFVSFAFRNKPAAFVGYSGGIAAGVRAVEHLAQVAIEAEMVPLRNTVLIPQVQNAFDADGEPTNPVAERSIAIMLDDLAWWGRVLSEARFAGQLPPAQARQVATAKSG